MDKSHVLVIKGKTFLHHYDVLKQKFISSKDNENSTERNYPYNDFQN